MEKSDVLEMIEVLKRLYPDVRCELNYRTPLELLIATILSAQCTDKRVNEITESLFEKYTQVSDYAKASVEQIAEDIYGLGLYKNKSRSIKQAAIMMIEEFNGEVPGNREDLEKLPGVGRKTASVVLSNAFGVPAIAVDTHVFRVSNRLGLAHADNVNETERQLMEAIPKSLWTLTHHLLIFHGRRVCHARNPKCGQCDLAPVCPSSLL